MRLPPRGVCRLCLGGNLVKDTKTLCFARFFVNNNSFRFFSNVLCSCFFGSIWRKCRKYHAFRVL